MNLLTGFTEDVLHALRALIRSPVFTLTAVATLAIGIGINGAVFTLSKAVLFSGFPSVVDNGRIAYVASSQSPCCLSYPDFKDWREQATSFQDMAVVHGRPVSLSDSTWLAGEPRSYRDQPEYVRDHWPTADLGKKFYDGRRETRRTAGCNSELRVLAEPVRDRQ